MAYYPNQQQPYPPPPGGQPYPPPVVGQPGGPVPMQPYPPTQGAPGQWMQRPVIPGCPPGLEYLTQIDQILVNQVVELLEAFVGIECQNQFAIKNIMGQTVYHAAEESGFCTRQCCGPHRGFVMHVADNMGQEVMRVTREFKCCAGCCWLACLDCCAYEVMVESPIGVPIGYVRQSCSLIKPCFEVMDENHEAVLSLSGPICICECPCCDVNFSLYSMDGEEIGGVQKQWSGLVKEIFTEADNFGIKFPMDLDVKVKATLMGAVFLINMMFFEKNQQRNQNN